MSRSMATGERLTPSRTPADQGAGNEGAGSYLELTIHPTVRIRTSRTSCLRRCGKGQSRVLARADDGFWLPILDETSPAAIHFGLVTAVHPLTDIERRVRELLADVYTPEGVETWLNAKNRNLSGNRPAELLAQGWGKDVLREAERVAGAL